uniref:SH3 and PX domains 2B n=1 Tax=Callorhinchus milii TaxID=7868 RepID=A0A4W3GQZ8_CALMI|eukprot:gi/632966490/ref/XP_007899449.1/ PREDICTED: SH3 and PX domain-containing protein 2B isoform X1 [Callorhinchus milii]
MPRRAIVDVRVEDVQKRRVPNKHYVYIIQVTWSNGSTEVIYRRYSRFFNLQMQLLDTFPVEGGQKDPKQRYIPFLPGKILFRRSHIRDVAVKRLKPIDEYCRALIRLPIHISQCDEVLQFFETRPEDVNPPKEEPIGKKKSGLSIFQRASSFLKRGGDGTSADQFFLDQYVAVTNYEKQESTEIGLRQGQVVEVIEKNESGWWFVSSADEQGWVPATCLEAQDGAQDDLLVVSAKPGEEENFVVIYPYSARDNDEIDLERGMMVQVIQKNLEGWWKIRYQGQEGWAPASYLKKATNEVLGQKLTSGQAIYSSATDLDAIGRQPSSKDSRDKAALFDQKDGKLELRGAAPSDAKGKLPSMRHRPPPRRDLTLPRGLNLPKPPAPPEVEEEYYTIAAFQTTIPDGISFQAGEKVEVIEKNLSGWWYIQINAEEGWAPASFIDKYKKTSNASRANFLPPLAQELTKLKLSDGAFGTSTNGGESTFPNRPLPKEPQASNHNESVEPIAHPKLKDWRTKDISKSPPSANKSNVSSDAESQAKPCPPSGALTADVSKLNKEKPLFLLKKEQVSSKFEAELSEKHSKGLPPKPPVPGGNLPILPPKMGPVKGDKKPGAEPSKSTQSKGLEAGPKVSVGEVARPHLKPVARPAKSKSDLEDKSVELSPNLALKPRPLLRPKPFPSTKGDAQPESEVDISNLRSKLRRAKAVDKVGEQDSCQPVAGNQNSSNNLPTPASSSSQGNVDNGFQMKPSSGTSCKGSDATRALQREQNGFEVEQNGLSVAQEKAGVLKNNFSNSKPLEKKVDDTQLKKTPSFNKEGPPRPQVPPRRPPLPKKSSVESAGQLKDTFENKPAWGLSKPAIPPPRPKLVSPHDHGKDDIKPRSGPKDALAIKGALPSKAQEHKRDPVIPSKETQKLLEKSEQGKEKVHVASVNLGEELSKPNLYVALADFVGDDETAGFKEGSIFELFEKNINGWWYCKILNPEPTWEGWVPSNYLTRKC